MDNLQELYQQVIIDHGTKPRNQGELQHCTYQAQGVNPLCGDELTLYLNVKNNIIDDVKLTSTGCAISTASASLMSQFLKGKNIDQAMQAIRLFTEMVTDNLETDYEALGKLKILAGVKQYPSRVKCATLAWHTLNAALENSQQPATTE